MAATRYYYSDTIDRFLTRSVNEIFGELTLKKFPKLGKYFTTDKIRESFQQKRILCSLLPNFVVFLFFITFALSKSIPIMLCSKRNIHY